MISYVPTAPTTQSGGFIGFVTSDIDHNPGLLTQDAALSDAFMRAGGTGFSPYEHASFALVNTEQEWYFTNLESEPRLSVPGSLLLKNTMDYLASNDTLQTGLLVAHYEFDCRLPVSEPSDTEPPPQSVQLDFGAFAMVKTNPVYLPLAKVLGFSATQAVTSKIFVGTLSDVTVTAEPQNWRYWVTSQSDPKPLFMRPGMSIYMRWSGDDPGGRVLYFFPTLADAMSGIAVNGYELEDSFCWTVSAAAPSPAKMELYAVREIPLTYE